MSVDVDKIVAQARKDAEAAIAQMPKRQQLALKYQLQEDLRKHEAILREKHATRRRRPE
jgi:hypothetical protein